MGSDLDLIAIVRSSEVPFERRAAEWDVTPLPVPADVLVYTVSEWEALRAGGGRFARTIEAEAAWLNGAPAKEGARDG